MTLVHWKPSAAVPAAPPLDERVRRARTQPASADLRRLASALDAIPNEDLDYDAWRDVIFGIHHATDGSDEGLALAHAFSERSPKYDPAFLDERVWPHIRTERQGNVITEHGIYARAVEHGWIDPTLADGFEPITDAPATPTPPKGRKFPSLALTEFTARPPLPWIVKGVLPKADVGVVFGPSGSGKTFFVLDLACAVARCLPEWRGHRVRGGRVLYIAAEGAAGVQKRFNAYGQHHEVVLAQVDLRVIAATPNFMDRDHVQDIIWEANATGPYELIIVDTLAKVSAGADENSGKDMGVLLDRCGAIRRHTGAMVLLVHHSGKDAAKGARGWSGIKGALDVEIEVARAGRLRSATVSKLKDGGDSSEYAFELRSVEVGKDEDGDPITSCVVEYTTGSVRTARAAEPKGANQRLAYETVRELVGLTGEPVAVDAVLDVMVPAMGSGPENDRRSNAKRALTGLAKAEFVLLEGDRVRLLEPKE